MQAEVRECVRGRGQVAEKLYLHATEPSAGMGIHGAGEGVRRGSEQVPLAAKHASMGSSRQ